MKHFLFSFLALLCCAPSSAPAAPDALARAPKASRLEGTITATANGITSTARISFQAPDQLRIDVQKDDAALIVAQTMAAAGDETRLFDAVTKRVHALPYNVAREWWRDWGLSNGGPANAALFGWSLPALQKLYTVKETTPGADGATGVLLVLNEGAGRRSGRDYVRTGGRGGQIYYAAFKRTVFDLPSQIALTFDAQTGAVSTRREMNENGRIVSQTTFTFDADSGLPRTAATRDGDNNLIASFNYDLKPRAEAFAGDEFALSRAPDQIIEDTELRPLTAYEAAANAAPDAAAHYNLGVALARHTEDFPAAFAAWAEAARLQPAAVAPHFATFDAALATRDATRASETLARLAQLLGTEHFEVTTRRARLAVLQRDWPAAQAALEAAQRAQPKHLGITLLRADVLRARGDHAAARALLLDILKSDAPQPLTQAVAAETFAAMADKKTAVELQQALPRDTPWLWLASAHLALLNGTQGGGAIACDCPHPAAQTSLAFALEQAGEEQAARDIWQKLAESTPAPFGTVAREHLMILHARRGDVSASLKAYADLAARTVNENARSSLRSALSAAWRKALRPEQLKRSLEQRSLATAAADEDLRLLLAFEEASGSLEDIGVAVQAGLERFPEAAWWHSRSAEHLMDEAAAQELSPPGLETRASLIRKALREVQAAGKNEASQSYYQVQRALVMTQRATFKTPHIDAGQRVADKNAALKTLDELQRAWPDDPDVQIAIGIQRLALAAANDLEPTIQLLRQALRGGVPAAESVNGDRHQAVFPARQALAAALRKAKKYDEAARQYETLLAAARDAGEEMGVAINYAFLLLDQKSAPALAQLLARLAREPWPFTGARQLMDNVVRVLMPHRAMSQRVATALRASQEPAARLAALHLDEALLRLARKQAADPKAPLDADVKLNEAARAAAASLQALQAIVTAADRVLAGRAAALLGEDALNRRDAPAAVRWLKTAVEIEPRDVNLRLALARAYSANKQQAEALAVRDDLLQTLPHTVENLRLMSILSLRLQLPDDAVRTALRAMNTARLARDVSPEDFETTALIAARALFAAGQLTPATEIYKQLAAAQWTVTDRAAALLDLRARFQKAGREDDAFQITEQLKSLKLTRSQLRTAQEYLASLD
ncbi:MAG TPA: hypothetical protein VNA16_09905 [Abditibacteriaceae bacterium]|nr:hypothetical protein [Abditibacteriaceae bacterium]